MELPPKPLLNIDDIFCETELEHIRRRLGSSRRFTAKSTVLRVAAFGIASFLPQAINIF